MNKTLDKLFSAYIRLRDEFMCTNCGATSEVPKYIQRMNPVLADIINKKRFKPTTDIVHCSHHVNRHFGYLRWNERNATTHCVQCHQKLENSPSDACINYEELRDLATKNEASGAYLVGGNTYSKYEKDEIERKLKEMIKQL